MKEMLPNWLQIAIVVFGALGGSGYLYELWKRKFPSNKDSQDLETSRSAQVKTLADTTVLYNQLLKHVDGMVQEKNQELTKEVEELRAFIVNKQLEYERKIQGWVEKATQLQGQLVEEIRLKEKYLGELNEVRAELSKAGEELNEARKELQEARDEMKKSNNLKR